MEGEEGRYSLEIAGVESSRVWEGGREESRAGSGMRVRIRIGQDVVTREWERIILSG